MCDLTPMTPYIAELRAMRARVEESLAWLDTLSPASAAAPLSGVAPPGPSGAGDPLVEQPA